MALHPQNRSNEPIAIIGTGFRFPGGSNTPEKLWNLLREPRDVQSTIPTDRFSMDGFYNPDSYQGMSHTRHGYFLSEDHRCFDAEFFGIKPVEAHAMDPQQRMLLEVIYESIETAGLSMEALRGSLTAVYVGLMSGDYGDMLNRDTSEFPPYLAAGTARSMMSNRVSYVFDWHGPSMTIDTACSSSLVAVHHAVQSLRLGDSQVAVAAGANLILGPEQFVAGSNMKMMSPDGRSYMWDSRANGYARGEGIAAVVLKTLGAAIADGDNIECVIVETGLNQDGKTKGLTVPSAAAQTKLIETTYRKAGLDLTNPSHRPQFFEAHGTGTPAGDPVEAQAIHEAFFGTKNTEASHNGEPLYCGSVKTVIGHTEGTAGLAGLIKTSLALQHNIIPPNCLFKDLAPSVRPFYKNLEIVTEPRPWPTLAPGSVRRASVNSFGFGGTNAHCILESYSPVRTEEVETPKLPMPFLFSAASEKSLLSMLSSHSQYLKTSSSIDLTTLSNTLSTKRTTHPLRVALTALGVEELFVKLDACGQAPGTKPILAAPACASPVRILGIFTGQGAQWPGMARQLMQLPAAVKIIEELEHYLAELEDPPSWSLKAELSKDASSSRVKEAPIAQPICTAVQILLVEMLRAAGVHFSAVVGHSSGEIAAAFAANMLSARDAIRIAYYRGVHLPLVGGPNGESGAMIAVGASYEEAQGICNSERFHGTLCVGASNSAASVTLSGDVEAIKEIKSLFNAQNRFARLLKVDNAYHSHHMKRCSKAITASVRACNIAFQQPNASECIWISSVDIKPVANDDILDYWHRNTVGCVFFSQALEHALKLFNFDVTVEVGAHPALKGPALQVIDSVVGHTIPYTGMLSRNVDDVEAFSDGLGYLWANVKDNIVDFSRYNRFVSGSCPPQVAKDLPVYPWDHERTYWYESRNSHTYRHRPIKHELLGIRTSDYSADQIVWKNHLVPRDVPWIQGHRIQGQTVFPGSAYIVSAFEAAREAAIGHSVELIQLMDFKFGQALVFNSEAARTEVLITLNGIEHRKSTMTANFTYHSVSNMGLGPMSLNAACKVRITLDNAKPFPQRSTEGEFGMTEVNSERIYASLADVGYGYSGAFKSLQLVKRKIGMASGLINTTATRSLIHPATLDAAMHSIAVAHSYPGDGRLASVMLPTDIAKISVDVSQASNRTENGILQFASSSDEAGGGDVNIYSADGLHTILVLEGLRTRPMVPATPANDVHMFSETVWGPANPMLEGIVEDMVIMQPSGDRDLKIMAMIAAQISYRYPAMNILNIGARAADSAKLLLTELDGAFASYTLIDQCQESLDEAKSVLGFSDDRITYKPVGASMNMADQGLIEQSFDLIVALAESTNTSDLNSTFKAFRRLLKPGGYILCPNLMTLDHFVPDECPKHINVESVDSVLVQSFHSLDATSWTLILKDCGFAEMNWLHTTKYIDRSTQPVMLLQAIDDHVSFLREPLSLLEPPLQFSEITIFGGAISVTSRCIDSIKEALQDYSTSLTQIDMLSDLDDDDILFGSNVIVLQDHDSPIFDSFSGTTLKGLQRLLEKSRNVLWVTQGYRSNLPHARMLVAFTRCLVQEMQHIRIQILDLPSSKELDATVISETFLRLIVTGRWEDEGHMSNMLWSSEPEIAYSDGHQFVPRVKLSKSRNSRYNSSRRMITQSVDLNVSPIKLSIEDGIYVLKARTEPDQGPSPEHVEIVNIRVRYSSLKAMKTIPSEYYYLVMGTDIATQEQVVALSSSLSSVVSTPKALVRPCTAKQDDPERYLRALLLGMISWVALRGLAPGQCLLVLEPHEDLSSTLAAFAAVQKVRVVFLSDGNAQIGAVHGCISKQMSSRASTREIRSLIHNFNPSRVIQWKPSHWTSSFCDQMPANIPVQSSKLYLADRNWPMCPTGVVEASRIFGLVQNQLFVTNCSIRSDDSLCFSLADLQGSNINVDELTTVDWSTSTSIPMRLEPADQLVTFHSNRTYWLIGLTGDLGLSLCEWMIARNATHIVLSSRNPNIDPWWLNHFESLDVTVKVLPCDVTDLRSVQKVRGQIEDAFPPIVGACHGAMVLRDSLVQDLSFPQVSEVLKPKVDGATNLDKVFANDDLEFFITLSSIAAVIGNPGQAAYAAGNGFLAALTAARRERGKAASCIALGAILGNGYATRGLTLVQQRLLEKAGVKWTSEQDFHAAFAEAVIACSPRSGLSGEFATGVPITYTDQEFKPKHANNPIFSHLLWERASYQRDFSDSPKMSTKAQLLHATTHEEVLQILEDFLTPRLQKALQMTSETNVVDQTAESLGIDSLVAVEMRSWLIKELNVDMPILVVIGGSTMRAVLTHCATLLDPTMTPLLESEVVPSSTQVPDQSAAANDHGEKFQHIAREAHTEPRIRPSSADASYKSTDAVSMESKVRGMATMQEPAARLHASENGNATLTTHSTPATPAVPEIASKMEETMLVGTEGERPSLADRDAMSKAAAITIVSGSESTESGPATSHNVQMYDSKAITVRKQVKKFRVSRFRDALFKRFSLT